LVVRGLCEIDYICSVLGASLRGYVGNICFRANVHCKIEGDNGDLHGRATTIQGAVGRRIIVQCIICAFPETVQDAFESTESVGFCGSIEITHEFWGY
jgi:hypothetical protein